MGDEKQKPEDLQSFLAALMSSTPKIQKQWFYKQRIFLDGYNFERCRFDQCEIYVAKGTFTIDHCFFAECSFYYWEHALRIVRLYNIMATEAQRLWPNLTPTVNSDGTISII